MDNQFFEQPDPQLAVRVPGAHWELDEQGQPTQRIIESRRRAEFITPIPKPKKRKGRRDQRHIVFDEGEGLSTAEQQYDPTSIINELRGQVDQWRSLPEPERVAGHARDRPPAPALAASQVQRHPPVLLPGRGRRDGHLAHRGRPDTARPASASSSTSPTPTTTPTPSCCASR